MLKNYMITLFRNLRRQRFYTLLNVAGLALGLTCFTLIFLYVQHELSYDKFNVNADRIYKVVKISQSGGYMGTNRYGVTPAPLAQAMMDQFPEVEAATRFTNEYERLLRAGDKAFYERGWVFADQHIFDVFTINLIEGDKKTVLQNKYSVVISEQIAEKYYGDENPVGKIINYNNNNDFTVTGVFKQLPKNSQLQADFFAAFETLSDLGSMLDRWGSSSYHTYFLLRSGADHLELEKKYPALLESNLKQYNWWKKEEADIYYNQPLTDIHLKADTIFNFGSVNDIKYIYIFSIIALFILLTACVNYMNLSTARSIKRAKEVGVRKVVGAQRFQLIGQFLSESVFLSFTALLLAIAFAYLLLPVFNGLVERELEMNFAENFGFFMLLGLCGLAAGLISGSYPAFFISNFKPVTTLKGVSEKDGKSGVLRNLLVVVQFSISIFLIIGTIVISNQLYFIRNKNLGFTKDRIVIVTMRDKAVRDNSLLIKEELLKNSQITSVSASTSLPMRISNRTSVQFEGSRNEDDGFQTYMAYVDYDFINLFEMEIVKGRNFIKDLDAASPSYIINETAAKELGWENPIGKEYGFSGKYYGRIVGVVKDFHYSDLHLPMEAVTFFLDTDRPSYFSIKLNTDDIQAAINGIEEVWNNFSDGYPFEYDFMDEQYDNMYKSEIRLGTTFKYFALIAIMICCLGLFGLALFTTEQSTKEIGIRKTLGASVGKLIGMLTWRFVKWILIANFFAWPAAYYYMNKWLEDFVYRVDLGWTVFIAAGLIALFIAFMTIIIQALKASFANPVDALRYE